MSNAKVRGTAAFGKFKLCESAADVTNAAVLTDASRETPVLLRFSTVLGSRGSADAVRDDAIKFPNVVHARKPEPHNEVPQAQSAHNNFWDFQFLYTEATHMFMWTQSDRAIPKLYRMMQGFGVNTYTLTNDKGERHFVKFHFTPELGVHSLVWDEALKVAGQDPDFHRKDLMKAIDMGDFEFDILDATKIWPEELAPIHYIGELELNRNVDEFFTRTEQVALCTSHVVPGIGFSDDPLLQGRNFSYFDTQLSRLGINWQELPIKTYLPQGGYVEFPEKLAGIKTRLRSKKFQEHFNQAQLFFNSLSEPEKAHIAAALSFELDHCDDPVVCECMCERLAEIDLKLAQQVAESVGGSIPQETKRPSHGKKTKNLSQLDFLPKRPTIASCRVAIIITDGFDLVGYAGIKAALTAAQAFPFTIGSRHSPIFPAGEDRKSGEGVKPDHHLEGMRSTMFDSIFIPGGADEAAALVKNTVDLPEITVSESAETQESYGVVTAAKITPKSFKGVFKMANGTKDFVDAYFYSISQHRNWDRELSGLSMQVAY
ncbi:catalase [Neofusicoccum parvum]|nr:catalase [Neofusicoccum parvum]